MLSQELKDLVNKIGGKHIIIEAGKPRYVVMSWNEYQRVGSFSQNGIETLTEEELVDKINSDIAIWRENQEKTDDLADEILLDEIEDLAEIEYV